MMIKVEPACVVCVVCKVLEVDLIYLLTSVIGCNTLEFQHPLPRAAFVGSPLIFVESCENPQASTAYLCSQIGARAM